MTASNRILALGLAATATLALPSLASANVAAPVCIEGRLSVSLTGWAGSPAVTLHDFTVAVSGEAAPRLTGGLTFTAPGTTIDAGALVGTAHVLATAQRSAGGTVFRAEADVSCPVPAPQPERVTGTPAVPVAVVPPGPVTPLPKVRTCADLRSAGAGPRSLRALGCTVPSPRKPTCAQLKAAGAGRLTYARAGFYYRCAPRPVARRVIPPVTG